jgi:Zn-dependent protease
MARGQASKGILITVGLLILSKIKWLFALLKFTKFGGTMISLVVSLGGYALIFCWRFAVALIYLIFIHEMGHLVAAKQKGIKTSPAIFVPFMGAVIGMKEQPKDAATEAYLAYGGPLAGLISIIPAFILYYFTGHPFWALVVMLGALINLFNLFPVSPLDGGRIVGVLSTNIWGIALLIFLVYLFFSFSPILLLIFIFGVISWWSRFRDEYKREQLTVHISAREKIQEKLSLFNKELFYSFQNDEGEPMLNTAMVQYHERLLNQELNTLHTELNEMNKGYIPIIQDKQKLAKEKLKANDQQISRLKSILHGIQLPEHLTAYAEQLRGECEQLSKERDQFKYYYKTKKSTKWKVFTAYVLLALVLSIIYLYFKEFLDQSIYYIK